MINIDKNGLPTCEGIFLVKYNPVGGDRIDVYVAGPKGLACFKDDFGSAGTDIGSEWDDHVSVRNTGLKFIRRVGDLR